MKACLSVLLVLLVQASASSFEILADSQTDDVYYNQTTYTGFYQMKPMPKPLSDITATLVPGSIFNDISFGDRIYVIGGCNTTQVI